MNDLFHSLNKYIIFCRRRRRRLHNVCLLMLMSLSLLLHYYMCDLLLGSSYNNNDLCEEHELISKNWTLLSYKSSAHPQQRQRSNSCPVFQKLSSKGHILLQPNI